MGIRSQAALIRAAQAARKRGDGLPGWTPYRKQQLFIDAVLKRKADENWFIAANRSGKSDAGAWIGSALARWGPQEGNPMFTSAAGAAGLRRSRPTSGWVVALDFPTSRDVIQPKYFDNGHTPPGATHRPFIPPHEIERWTVSSQILKLKNGSIIGFKSADSGRTKFQGSEKDWVHFDEEPGEDIYQEAVIRVGQHRLNVFGTCTLLPPQGEAGGVTWLHPKRIGEFLRLGDAAPAHVYGASIYDNPHLDGGEVKRLEAIYPQGSVERRIRLEGEWLPGMSGARAYTAFERDFNVAPQRDRYSDLRPLAWMWDFNVEPMVSLAGQRDGPVFRVFQEFTKEDGDIPAMCERFMAAWGRHRGEVHVYGDATGNSRTAQTGRSSYYFIINSCMPLRGRLKIKVPDSNPPVVDRVNAVNLACRDEDSMRSLMVDPECPELIADFEQVLRDRGGGIKKSTSKRDAYYWRTHYTDALGYWVSACAPVGVRGPAAPHSLPAAASRAPPIPQPSYGRPEPVAGHVFQP